MPFHAHRTNRPCRPEARWEARTVFLTVIVLSIRSFAPFSQMRKIMRIRFGSICWRSNGYENQGNSEESSEWLVARAWERVNKFWIRNLLADWRAISIIFRLATIPVRPGVLIWLLGCSHRWLLLNLPNASIFPCSLYNKQAPPHVPSRVPTRSQFSTKIKFVFIVSIRIEIRYFYDANKLGVVPRSRNSFTYIIQLIALFSPISFTHFHVRNVSKLDNDSSFIRWWCELRASSIFHLQHDEVCPTLGALPCTTYVLRKHLSTGGAAAAAWLHWQWIHILSCARCLLIAWYASLFHVI